MIKINRCLNHLTLGQLQEYAKRTEYPIEVNDGVFEEVMAELLFLSPSDDLHEYPF